MTVTRAFFFASVAAVLAVAYWRMTTWTMTPIVPQYDLPTLMLLGILAHFAFDRSTGPTSRGR